MKTILTFLILPFFIININAQTGTVDEMPRFPSCENKRLDKTELSGCATAELLKFVYGRLRYPPEAKRWKTEGTVFAQFFVDTDGSIVDANIVKGIGDGCDEEVLRVIAEMPLWIPGMQKGKPVKVSYTLPVKFALDNRKQD